LENSLSSSNHIYLKQDLYRIKKHIILNAIREKFLVQIETNTNLEKFRKFLIINTCESFIPESYFRDSEVFPEKEGEFGSMYVEAADKVTLKKIREITFINANGILGIIYISKSGNTKLKWRQIRGKTGRVTGEASINSLVNLITAGVLTEEYTTNMMKKMMEAKQES